MDTKNELLGKINRELKQTLEEKKIIAERKRLLELFECYDETDRVVSFKELLKEFQGLPDLEGIKVGLPELDKKTNGFKEGNVIVVSGTTGSGKTALLQTFVKNVSQKNIPVLFFTYEVPAREFLKKFEDNMPEFAFIPRRHKSSKLDWLESRILEGIAKYETKIIMIDHLHFLLDMKMLAGGNTSLLIGGVMRELKRIAIEYNLIIFLVAHTKKTRFNENELPDLTALRDSGMVAAESDFVIFIDRKLTQGRR